MVRENRQFLLAESIQQRVITDFKDGRGSTLRPKDTISRSFDFNQVVRGVTVRVRRG
jgi:hypothetical protein